MPSQASVIRQAPAPAASKTRVAGREADVGHRVAGDVQHRERRGVEGVVVGGADVAEPAHVGAHRLVLPAVAAEQEAPVRQPRRRLEEEALDARLAVRQPVGEKAEVRGERGLRGDRVVSRGVVGVVDRPAGAGAEAFVGGDDGRAAAVGQHEVERRKRAADRVGGVGAHLGERRRGVDVPEHPDRIRPRRLHDAGEQEVVEDADAARLDDHVGRRGLGDDARARRPPRPDRRRRSPSRAGRCRGAAGARRRRARRR